MLFCSPEPYQREPFSCRRATSWSSPWRARTSRALGLFAQSQDPFDVWFKQRLAEVTEVDLGNLPPDMHLPELVSRHDA
jgi:hypothetical protein